MVVVLSILVVNTLVQIGPLAFLSLGEKSQGQIDAIFSPYDNPVYTTNEYTHFSSKGAFYNYTQVMDVVDYNFAPRKQMWNSYYEGLENEQTECRITLIQTDREQEI